MDHLEEIRARIGIEELVGGYVQLKKAGRNLKGLCPFHGEKTPSFVVSPEKGIAHCFGCHQGGDIFKFTQIIENVSFGEAVKMLAERAGVTLPNRLPKTDNKRLKSVEINQLVVKFYQEQLEKNEKQKEYFLKRGLTEATIQKFKLGLAPDSFDQLKNHLIEKGYQTRELIDAAVVSQRSIADQNIYDRFRNRLMFPIFDHQDNPVGFSGRIIGEGEPKYINSPETPAYNKSLILYGLNWAKENIKKEGKAIFMEGYMDVIAAHQAGTTNAVATCGTALTPQQLKLIQRYTQNVIFCFDGDSAGKEATLRAIELAQTSDLNLSVIQVPEGKDPDECIQKNPEAWKKAVQNPVTVMDFYFDIAFKRFDPATVQGKKQILDFLLPLIKIYKSDVEQGEYLNRLALAIKTDVKLLWNDLAKSKKVKSYAKTEPETGDIKKTAFRREEFLLGFLFSFPELYKEIADNLIDNIPFDPDTERFYNALRKVYTLESSVDLRRIKEEMAEEDQGKIDVYRLVVEEYYADLSEEIARRESRKLIREINRKNLYNIQKEYEYKIRLSENPQEKMLLLNRYNEILKLTTRI